MGEKLISVIVPVYNTKSYLRKCIDSIVGQTYHNLEIILIDDGSTDGSSKICDEYANKDSRIIVIHKSNEGLVKARKDGIRYANGTYVGYVDGDDWIEPEMYKKLYEIIASENVDVVMCGRFEDTGESRRAVYHGIGQGKYDKEKLVTDVYPRMIVNNSFFEWGLFPSVWDKLFKKSFIEKFQLEVDDNLMMGEDAACIYPAILNAQSIYILQECLYHYRQSSASMVKKKENSVKSRERFRLLYRSVYNKLEDNKGIYDLRKQWLEYLLFLMVPRADQLYLGYSDMDYLFPFPNVKKGCDIILYGMGTYGQMLYRYLEESHFCNVLACADKNHIELNKQGWKLISPEEIGMYKYDHIVVANSFANVRDLIWKDLTINYQYRNIEVIDETLIKCTDTLAAFGLI